VDSPAPRRPDDPVLAIASPPRVARLLALAGLAPDARVEGNFSGWSKLALLADDRVLLVPRDHIEAASLHREERALRALETADLDLVPRILAWHPEHDATRLPLLVVNRLDGVSLESLEETIPLDDLARVLEQVGRAAARWHHLDPALVDDRSPRRTEHRQGLDALLGRDDTAPEQTAAELVALLGMDPLDLARCAAAIERIRAMPDVLVHSDLHAGQMLVDPDSLTLTGILDWQGARRDHPFVDVDLGEWSTAMWRRHRCEFTRLRTSFWEGYATAVGVPVEDGLLCDWVWSVAHVLSFDHIRVGGDGREDVVGTRDEAIAAARAATGRLPT
jgi:aminoglycoside phosphotransferase (APT) family kinase protein